MKVRVAFFIFLCNISRWGGLGVRPEARSTAAFVNGVSTAPTKLGNKVSIDAYRTNQICNTKALVFNDDLCFEYTLGRTRAQLNAELLDFQPSSFSEHSNAAGHDRTLCPKLFYLWSFNEFEKAYPDLSGCQLSTYAALAQATALKQPCRASSLLEADILMLPPYLAAECNWPAYGSGNCTTTPANLHRAGHEVDKCGASIMAAVADVQAIYGDKRVLLLDTNSLWEPYALPKAEYAVEGRIWAKGDSLAPYYRPHLDISMPPASFPRCRQTPRKAYEDPVSAKRYFVSFQGQMRTPVRQTLQQLVNNDVDQIVLDKSSPSHHDYDELLHDSRFNLILAGDVPFSYRFNEAVCSGGVPVLVTEQWIPPLSEFLDFDSYGVLVKESDIHNLVPRLRAMTDEDVEIRRKNARAFCTNAFQTTEASLSALLSFVVSAY